MYQKQHEPVYLQDYKVPDFLVDTIDLEIQLTEEVAKIKSRMHLYANPMRPHLAHELVLHGEHLVLKSIKLDGKELDALQYRVTDTHLTIYSVPEKMTVEIETWTKPQDNTELSGLYKSSGNYCTQCEAEGFRRITYFLDRPDVMAKYTTKIIADEARYPVLLSNGNQIGKGSLGDGRHWVMWEDPFRKPCYLFAMVAGNLECVADEFITSSGKKVKLEIYVEKGNTDKCSHAMAAVKKAMRWDEEVYGREYDLDIYMIVAVSDFNMGAMENKGLNIFNAKYVLAKPETATDEDFIHVEAVIAHEYFHNWTGNRITCRDWFQLSLKEGLTIFRDQSFTADTTSKTVARIHDVIDLRTSQFTEDAGPLSHPVRPDSYIEINNFYTATIYNKGSEVIRMIKTIIGDEAFFKGMDLYFSRNDGKAVTIENFVEAMEEASGVDLSQFRAWYFQSGTPLLQIKDHYDAANQIYALTMTQSCAPTPGQNEKQPFHIPIRLGLLDADGNQILETLLQLKKPTETFTFNDIKSRPIPSLLRFFSAPVKVQYPYQDKEYALLFKHDKDNFNRWEAGQKFAISVIMELVKQFQTQQMFVVNRAFIDAFRFILSDRQNDKMFLAELLTLPSEKYLAEQMDIIDVEGVHAAREFLLAELAKQLSKEFFTVYEENNNLAEAYQFTMQEIGKRRLRNLCLHYLAQLPEGKDLAYRQYQSACQHNMTDTMAALRSLINIKCDERDLALNDFFVRWQHDSLVVDKWLSIQAESKLPDALKQVQMLLEHPIFDIKNPNKVYALIAAFAFRNQINFHVANGNGYEWLASLVIKIDGLNPSVASRIIKPLTDWRRFDDDRQKHMRAQLERILQHKKISKDIYELASKSLG